MVVLASIPDATADTVAALGRLLALMMRGGQTLRLEGPVGAGKSHLARAFLRTRLRDPQAEVPSPSFTLVQPYTDAQGVEIAHVDLYRLDGGDLPELGLDDLEDGIRLIEWPDRLPADDAALTVALAPTADDRRAVTLSGAAALWQDAARAAQIADFLQQAGWAGAEIAMLAGDASVRRYLRLSDETRSAVLMDAPPGSCGPTVAVTEWLRAKGFHAPRILAADAAAGLLLLEDLGDDLLARWLEANPTQATAAYGRVADLLADLHRHPPMESVPALDAGAAADQVGLFAEWYVPAAGGDAGAVADLGSIVHDLCDRICAGAAPVMALRDLHAENIVWQGERPLGLLDFQDAVAAHPAYDLASALQDVRRDVPPAVEAATIARYLQATGGDGDSFAAAYALLGTQRNLRIMGIFTRLCLRDGKPRYLDFMPRAWALIQRNLAHPALAPLAAALAAVPPPSQAVLDGIRARCRTL